MSTQPVPTFPVVAGYEKYYGMPLDEVIEAVKLDEEDRVNWYSSQLLDPKNSSDAFIEWEPKNREHLKFLYDIEMDETKDIYTRASAWIISAALTK